MGLSTRPTSAVSTISGPLSTLLPSTSGRAKRLSSRQTRSEKRARIQPSLHQRIRHVGQRVLARLLTPAEVGLFPAGTVLARLLLTVSEGSAEAVSWASLGTNVLWAGATVAAAPAASWLFG